MRERPWTHVKLDVLAFGNFTSKAPGGSIFYMPTVMVVLSPSVSTGVKEIVWTNDRAMGVAKCMRSQKWRVKQ